MEIEAKFATVLSENNYFRCLKLIAHAYGGKDRRHLNECAERCH
jgi:hypothetical protein